MISNMFSFICSVASSIIFYLFLIHLNRRITFLETKFIQVINLCTIIDEKSK